MNLQQLETKVGKGEIDTVITVFPDVFGRLVGKRFTGQFFLDHVARDGTHCCNYLLTVDIEMEPMTGFKVANWEKGFGDFGMKPDLATLRGIPWLPGAALVLCDFVHEDGKLVDEAPRSVLQRQIDALAGRKFVCNIASELEFFLYKQTYEEAFANGFRNLVPSSDYRIDYHTMQTTRDEPLFRGIRNLMGEARVPVESSKGEWGRGQHEVNFTYSEPLEMADRHVIFKQGVKELAAQQQRSVTFMAKPAMNEPGNSCHIHCSLWE